MFQADFNQDDVILTHSFLLTINSNKSYDEDELPQAKRRFISDLTMMFNNFENFIDAYLSVKAGGSKYNRKKLNVEFKNVAKDVRVIPKIEIGKKQRRLHCHALLQWSSDERFFFQVNHRAIRQFINEAMDESYHCDIKWVKGASDLNNIIAYINKDR